MDVVFKKLDNSGFGRGYHYHLTLRVKQQAIATNTLLYRVDGGEYLLMTKLTKNQILDFEKFYKSEGDSDFSAKRNMEIVENSIKEYELKRKLIQERFNDDMAERSDAVAFMLKSIDNGKTTDALKYFGKKELARLRGEEILGQMRFAAATMKSNLDATKKRKN